MKTHVEVSSSRRKQRRAHFSAPSHIRHRIMSSTLSKTLRTKYGVRALPIRKDDEVVILRGTRKGSKGKVIQVHRKKWAIHIDKITKNKANGAPYQIPIHPSNVAITKIKEGKDRVARIATIAAGVNARKGKADKKIKTTN
jgi:large subunit ribosomal protein L26e